MKVSLFDTKVNESEEITKLFKKLLKNGQYVLGNNVNSFESSLGSYLNSKYVVGVNSGTDAIELSLKALGVKKGDYVITSGFTYFATIEAVHNVGAIPHIVDIDVETLQINLDSIEKKFLNKAKFIIPVHLFGGYADIPKLMELSKNYELKIIEDVAQSFGTKYKDKHLGTFGDAGAFSFYPTKTLGSIGDAGAITTNNKFVYEDLLMLRNHGHIDRDNFKFAGRNSRLDEIQAMFLNLRLKNIDEEIKKRVEIANIYMNSLDSISNITFYNSVLETFNYFPITVQNLKERDDLVNHLNSRDIDTAIYYRKPLSDLTFDWISKSSNFTNINFVKDRILCLPLYPSLKMNKLKYTINTIKSFYK